MMMMMMMKENKKKNTMTTNTILLELTSIPGACKIVYDLRLLLIAIPDHQITLVRRIIIISAHLSMPVWMFTLVQANLWKLLFCEYIHKCMHLFWNGCWRSVKHDAYLSVQTCGCECVCNSVMLKVRKIRRNRETCILNNTKKT